MSQSVWQRARRPEQKEQRRAAILQAAAVVYERDGLEQASLNAIAREAAISKANIYRYFESREEIYLHLALEDYRGWVTAVERALAPLAATDDEAAVSHAWVTTLGTRPRLCSLASSMTMVLERNVSVDVVARFKTRLLDLTRRLANTVQVAMPSLTPGTARRFTTYAQMLTSGMWTATTAPAAVQKAMERPELQDYCLSFERDLETALATVLRGLRA